jgi:hypothetical protein
MNTCEKEHRVQIMIAGQRARHDAFTGDCLVREQNAYLGFGMIIKGDNSMHNRNQHLFQVVPFGVACAR